MITIRRIVEAAYNDLEEDLRRPEGALHYWEGWSALWREVQGLPGGALVEAIYKNARQGACINAPIEKAITWAQAAFIDGAAIIGKD